MNDELMAKLVCPICRVKLQKNEISLACHHCGQSYHFIGNIPNFLPEEMIQRYNTVLKYQDLEEEKNFYEKMYKDLKGLDDGHCVVYGYDEIYDFMADVPLGTLLDVGCGAGHHSKDLGLRGYNVAGVDISLKGLKQAEMIAAAHKLDISYLLGDCENLPFEDNSFDVVFCSLIIHHFPKKDKLLSEIARVCRQYFVTFEVNSYDPISFLRFNIINPTIGIHNITKNQRTVSPVGLEKDLRKLGFDNISVKYVDVHHNEGRYPGSFEAKMLRTYRAAAMLLPYKCRFNKFIMKGKKE